MLVQYSISKHLNMMNLDYYPFGQTMPGRNWISSVGGYRYSHNGHEKENEIFEGAQSAEYWMYDSRLGRRWEQDPVVKEYESPYATFGNNPIYYSDPLGLDKEDEVVMSWNEKLNKYEETSRDKTKYGPDVTLIHYRGGVNNGVNQVISPSGTWSNGGNLIVNADKNTSDVFNSYNKKTKESVNLGFYMGTAEGENYYGYRSYGGTGWKSTYDLKFASANLNWGKSTSKTKAGVDVAGKAGVLKVGGGLEYGTNETNTGVFVNGDVLSAQGSIATGGLGGENGWVGFAVGGEGGASGLSGEGGMYINYKGTKLTASLAGQALSAGGGLSVGILYNKSTKTFRIYGIERLGILPIGQRAALSLEINSVQMKNIISTVRNFTR